MTAIDERTRPANAPLLAALAANWWLVLLRGLAALAFGVMAFAWPLASIFALVVLYGCYALVDGVIALAAAIRGGAVAPRWWLALSGLLGIAAGGIALVMPGTAALALLLLIGAWSIVRGILEIAGAISLRKQIDNEWFLALSGCASVLFGVLLLAWPASGALAMIWLIGAYALLFGALLVWLAFRLRARRA